MPRIRIQDPGGMNFGIDTRSDDTLRAWFDEVLPWTYWTGRTELGDPPVIWPKIWVNPMWAWKIGTPTDPDWLADTRVTGFLYDFPAKDGESGMRELGNLRQRLRVQLDADYSRT